MESSNFHYTIPYTMIFTIILVAVLVGFFVHFMYFTPKFPRTNEGFFGGVARGSGHPDCLRTLPEGSEILDVLLSRVNPIAISEGSADYREFQLILSKLGCLKKDLMSPSGMVEATRYQAFETAHDRINVGEVCAMCLNQTIAPRDLDIVFATWRDRGRVLLRKLCTEAQLTEQDVVKLEVLYNRAWSDVYNISRSKCLKTDFSLQNGGQTLGDVGGYEPEHLKDLRSYDYKYGNMNASGWNGAV
jgi:hypothetical protein